MSWKSTSTIYLLYFGIFLFGNGFSFTLKFQKSNETTSSTTSETSQDNHLSFYHNLTVFKQPSKNKSQKSSDGITVTVGVLFSLGIVAIFFSVYFKKRKKERRIREYIRETQRKRVDLRQALSLKITYNVL
nr:uncharacterized protein LOC101241758 [Hydra vulgaris]